MQATINLDSVLALNLISKADRIAELKANIETWKAAQVAEAHSKTAIFYYCDLVMEARAELERLGA
jgi:uncharacterized protein YfaP (DUF2135 family)